VEHLIFLKKRGDLLTKTREAQDLGKNRHNPEGTNKKIVGRRR